jgi:hypothetical protein
MHQLQQIVWTENNFSSLLLDLLHSQIVYDTNQNKIVKINSLQTYHTNKNLLASIRSLELSQKCAYKICTGILYIVVSVFVQLVGTQYKKLLKQIDCVKEEEVMDCSLEI